ncbi:MAG: 4Fe-4S binding protein [Desulfobacteraceae bacterium]|nr:nitroreductase family protein [Desulfobacteraceae bacterium]MBC2755793.1 4Fe-4S binding protein [Desulfobacteraceae bacterium]
MPAITIDETLCIKDGLCSTICPMQIITPPKGEIPPEPKPEFSKWCTSCGHCVSICPTGALSHSSMNPDQCPTADYKLIPGPDQFEHILRLRRSIRRFKKTPPEKEVIERLISMAGYAPSGHNFQPVRWQVFTNRDDLNQLVDMVCDWMKHMLNEMPEAPHAPVFKEVVKAWNEGKDLVLHEAPCLVLAHSRIQTGTEPTDAAISLAYLDLAALSLGMGCCWAGLFTMAAKLWEPFGQFLDLPKGHQLHGAMMVGYPKLKFQRLPVRNHPEIQWR